VVDCLRGLRGSPASIVSEYAALLRSYNVSTVTGDAYAGTWPGDEFRRHGIRYAAAELNRSGLYLELMASLNSGRVELPPDLVLSRQLAALERRTGRSGRDAIDHPPNAHDDRANAVAGMVATASIPSRRGGQVTVMGLY